MESRPPPAQIGAMDRFGLSQDSTAIGGEPTKVGELPNISQQAQMPHVSVVGRGPLPAKVGDGSTPTNFADWWQKVKSYTTWLSEQLVFCETSYVRLFSVSPVFAFLFSLESDTVDIESNRHLDPLGQRARAYLHKLFDPDAPIGGLGAPRRNGLRQRNMEPKAKRNTIRGLRSTCAIEARKKLDFESASKVEDLNVLRPSGLGTPNLLEEKKFNGTRKRKTKKN